MLCISTTEYCQMFNSDLFKQTDSLVSHWVKGQIFIGRSYISCISRSCAVSINDIIAFDINLY